MKPARNPQYLAWIRTLPCSVCHTTGRIEAAHTGPHGIGQKSADTSAIPLCQKHHRTGNDSYHKLGPRRFAEVHKLDVSAIAARLNAKPYIRVESGAFVGRVHGHEYWLGPTRDGLQKAIRRMSELRREAQREVAEVVLSPFATFPDRIVPEPQVSANAPDACSGYDHTRSMKAALNESP
jgi:hypothetical protein